MDGAANTAEADTVDGASDSSSTKAARAPDLLLSTSQARPKWPILSHFEHFSPLAGQFMRSMDFP